MIVELYFIQLVAFRNGQFSCYILPSLDLCIVSVWLVGTDSEPTKKDGFSAPEIILGAKLETKVDVWALGCMVGLIVLLPLQPIPYQSCRPSSCLPATPCLTQKVVKLGVLKMTIWRRWWRWRGRRSAKHCSQWVEKATSILTKKVSIYSATSLVFNAMAYSCGLCVYAGKLHHIDHLLPFKFSLKRAMTNFGVPQAEVLPAAEFIHKCLHLNPQDCTPAMVLQAHSWLKKSFYVLLLSKLI